jgi:hypothetical protein
LLDLCLCNPLSSLLIGVECNCFYSSVHLHYATNHISLYFFLWCITPDYCCLVDGSVDLGSVVASFFQHFSCPGFFLFLPSPLILMFAICGWLSCQISSIFAPLSLCWLMCHFFQSTLSDNKLTPFSSALEGYRPREAWELAPDHWTSVIVVVVKSFQGKLFSSLRDSACEYCCHSKW